MEADGADPNTADPWAAMAEAVEATKAMEAALTAATAEAGVEAMATVAFMAVMTRATAEVMEVTEVILHKGALEVKLVVVLAASCEAPEVGVEVVEACKGKNLIKRKVNLKKNKKNRIFFVQESCKKFTQFALEATLRLPSNNLL